MNRKEKLKIKIGNIYIGGNETIKIQSMSTFLPSNFNECLNQILSLEKAGCEIIRVAIKTKEDAILIKKLKENIHIPIVADIHFDYNLGIIAIENGADKIRFNPGNIGSDDNLKKLILKCKEYNIPVRIGVNSGSIQKEYKDLDIPMVDKAIKSLEYYIKQVESLDYYNIVLSIKMTDVDSTIEAYEKVHQMFNYPLHIGLTEAGVGDSALIKSSICLSSLLKDGIGDTIRVSLTGDPLKEVYAAKDILKTLNLTSSYDLISCPTCGRCQVDLEKYAKDVDAYLKSLNKNIKVAVMGCAVNGPGEAENADIGIAFFKDSAVVFKKGSIIYKGSIEESYNLLINELNNY